MRFRSCAVAALLALGACHDTDATQESEEARFGEAYRDPQAAAPVEIAAVAQREHAWAEPLTRPGLPNLHRISDELYRGAQPSEEGFRELARMGVKTVLSLRGFHADSIPKDLPLQYERISFKAWHPEAEDIRHFLQVVRDPARQPVFVHCQHGADRTGMMCAIWRVSEQGWSKDEALAEMTQGGFGFHPLWSNLVRFVRELDSASFASANASAPAKR